MSDALLCKICGKRRPKRFCPAVSGEICSICCGEEREVSLTCPLDCSYLKEAHRREKPVPVAADAISYPDVEITEDMVRELEELLLFSIYSLVQASLRTSGAIDSDLMAALAALIQTKRTLQSGLVYETRPENTLAAEIQRRFQSSLDDYEQERSREDGLNPLRDADVLAVLVFLHRIGQQNQNGRPRGRMFIDLLRQMTPDGGGVPESASSIIL